MRSSSATASRSRPLLRRWGTGARAPQRHPERGRHRRPWPRPPRLTVDERDDDGRPGRRAARPAGRRAARRRARRRRDRCGRPPPRHKVAGSCPHVPRRASRARRCCSCSSGRGLRLGRVVVRQRRHGAVARAGRHGRRPRRWPAARCGCRSAGRPPTPTSTSPSTSCPPPSPRLAPTVSTLTATRGAGRHVAVASTRRWPPPCCVDDGHEVVGVTLKLWGGDSDTGLLLGERRRRRPPGGRPARHRPPRVQLRRRLRRPRRRARTSPTMPPGAPRTPASSATATSSSTGCCERADAARLRRGGHRAPRPRRRRLRRAAGASRAAPIGPRTRAT